MGCGRTSSPVASYHGMNDYASAGIAATTSTKPSSVSPPASPPCDTSHDLVRASKAIREWVLANGFELSDRGRIANKVIAAVGAAEAGLSVEPEPCGLLLHGQCGRSLLPDQRNDSNLLSVCSVLAVSRMLGCMRHGAVTWTATKLPTFRLRAIVFPTPGVPLEAAGKVGLGAAVRRACCEHGTGPVCTQCSYAEFSRGSGRGETDARLDPPASPQKKINRIH